MSMFPFKQAKKGYRTVQENPACLGEEWKAGETDSVGVFSILNLVRSEPSQGPHENKTPVQIRSRRDTHQQFTSNQEAQSAHPRSTSIIPCPCLRPSRRAPPPPPDPAPPLLFPPAPPVGPLPPLRSPRTPRQPAPRPTRALRHLSRSPPSRPIGAPCFGKRICNTQWPWDTPFIRAAADCGWGRGRQTSCGGVHGAFPPPISLFR